MRAIDLTLSRLSPSSARVPESFTAFACRASMLEITCRLFFTRWWISFSSTSLPRSSSACLRAVTSRTSTMTSFSPLATKRSW